MRIRDDELEEEPRLELTPLIDVVFLLLIFFMVATTFLDPEERIDVNLPQAESGRSSDEVPDELLIHVLADGRTMLAGREVDLRGLQGALERAAQLDATTPVTIRGDAVVEHQRIVSVMDACALAGLSNLSVGTLRSGAQQGG